MKMILRLICSLLREQHSLSIAVGIVGRKLNGVYNESLLGVVYLLLTNSVKLIKVGKVVIDFSKLLAFHVGGI